MDATLKFMKCVLKMIRRNDSYSIMDKMFQFVDGCRFCVIYPCLDVTPEVKIQWIYKYNLLTDVCGLSSIAAQTSFTRWLETLGLPGLSFLTSPTSLNCLTHFLIKFLCGGDLLISCLYLLWAVMIDQVSWTNLTNLALSATAAIVNKHINKRIKLWRHNIM